MWAILLEVELVSLPLFEPAVQSVSKVWAADAQNNSMLNFDLPKETVASENRASLNKLRVVISIEVHIWFGQTHTANGSLGIQARVGFYFLTY